MVGNKIDGIKSENFKLFLESKNITEEEYFKLVENSKLINNLIDKDYEKFIEQMAEKYKQTLEICGLPPEEISPKVEVNKRFTNFMKLEVYTKENLDIPRVIVSKDDIDLVKHKNYEKDENFYSVNINNKDIGLTTCASFSIEKVKESFEKECYFRNLEKEKEKTLQQMIEYSFGYDTDFSKVLVFDEKVIGRKSELIKFFKEELKKVDKYFKEPEKEATEREEFLKSTKETIEELEENNGKQSLEPIVLHLHSMDNTFHILNEKEELEQLKYYSEYIEELLEETSEEEEELEE